MTTALSFPGFSPLPAVSRSMKFAEGTVKRKFLSRTTRLRKPRKTNPCPSVRFGNWPRIDFPQMPMPSCAFHYADDLSIEEVAQVLGKGKIATKVMLHRARKKLSALSDQLKDHYETLLEILGFSSLDEKAKKVLQKVTGRGDRGEGERRTQRLCR